MIQDASEIYTILVECSATLETGALKHVVVAKNAARQGNEHKVVPWWAQRDGPKLERRFPKKIM